MPGDAGRRCRAAPIVTAPILHRAGARCACRGRRHSPCWCRRTEGREDRPAWAVLAFLGCRDVVAGLDVAEGLGIGGSGQPARCRTEGRHRPRTVRAASWSISDDWGAWSELVREPDALRELTTPDKRVGPFESTTHQSFCRLQADVLGIRVLIPGGQVTRYRMICGCRWGPSCFFR